jgi:hypothetical protein
MFLTGAWVVEWFMFLTGAWVVEWFMFLTGNLGDRVVKVIDF